MSEKIDETLYTSTEITQMLSVMRPTLNFRWIHRLTEGKVLQQQWSDVFSPDSEWRDVPTVEEE